MDSCSSLKFGDFISTAACSLCGIGSGVVSGIFGLWYSIVFSLSMGCGGRCEFLPSAPSLFGYVFDLSDDEEESEVYVFTVRVVMLIMVLISSEASISFTLTTSLKMSVNRATHIIFISPFSGSVSLIHC